MTLFHVVPFAAWIFLLSVLPATATAYAVRTGVTLALLLVLGRMLARDRAFSRAALLPAQKGFGLSLAAGLAVGILVLILWVVLPAWPYAAVASSEPSPFDPAVCGWGLYAAKLFGSAFVIAPVEEFFFRSYLYRRLQAGDFTSVPLSRFDLSAFLWVMFLFTLEHNRPLAALACGALYGFLAVRVSLVSAIVAHVVTNLLLGLWVLQTGAWSFW